MGRKVYHCLVFLGRSRPFLQQTRPLVAQQHTCLCLFLSVHPPLPTPASLQHLRCLFSKMPAHICAPLIHLSSFMSAALVAPWHKSHPGALAPAGTYTTTSNNKSVEPRQPQPQRGHIDPATPCLADYFAHAPCFRDTMAVKGTDASVTGFSLQAAVRHGSCHRKRLEDSVGKGKTEGGRHSARLHSNTNRNKELVLAWQLAGWLTRRRFSSNSQQLNNPCKPPLTLKPGLLKDTLNINTLSRSCLLGFLSFGHSKRHSSILIGQERVEEITKQGSESRRVKFSPAQLNILSDSEWRTQETSFTPLRWGQYVYLDLLQCALPNIGALISWPNLEISSSNLIYPSWNGLFWETSAEHGGSLLSPCLLHVCWSKLLPLVCCCLKGTDRVQYTHISLYLEHIHLYWSCVSVPLMTPQTN